MNFCFYSKDESFFYSRIKTFHFARFLLLIYNSVISIYFFKLFFIFFSHACTVVYNMWKTRFEVRTSHNNGFTRHRYYSRPSPTVPRVREDSPSAIVRPSPPSSISNLEILPEEDEDIPFINNEQPNLTSLNIRKQNSYQNLPKYQFVLPTIVESHDHEILIDNESYDDKCKQDNSIVATNTNYNNQIENIDFERTLKNNEMMEFTLDKRINELLQQKKSQRQNKVREIMLLFATSIYRSRNLLR